MITKFIKFNEYSGPYSTAGFRYSKAEDMYKYVTFLFIKSTDKIKLKKKLTEILNDDDIENATINLKKLDKKISKNITSKVSDPMAGIPPQFAMFMQTPVIDKSKIGVIQENNVYELSIDFASYSRGEAKEIIINITNKLSEVDYIKVVDESIHVDSEHLTPEEKPIGFRKD